MSDAPQSPLPDTMLARAIDLTVRIGLLIILALWCFEIVKPFIGPIAWGVIIAVALYPVHERMRVALGGSGVTASTLLTLLVLLLMIVPSVMLSGTAIEGVTRLAENLRDGSLTIPLPPESVAGWPLIGERLSVFWTLAANNLEAALAEVAPRLTGLSGWLLARAAGVGMALLQFVVSIIIAGVMLANAPGGARMTNLIASRFGGKRGLALAGLAVATVRSVAQGVLGVAFIQSVLAGLGMMLAGVPAAGLWALLVLLLAIVQLPALLILGPVIGYVFWAESSTTVAVVFAIWSVAVSMSDTVLKPLLLGRGLSIPMLVILIGAIGGMLSSGIIGLFVGSVVLAVGYTLFIAWLGDGEPEPGQAAPAEADGDGRSGTV